jgi:hypothetical protein
VSTGGPRLVGICNVGASLPCVVRGLVPGIHDFKTWIAETSPAMTVTWKGHGTLKEEYPNACR